MSGGGGMSGRDGTSGKDGTGGLSLKFIFGLVSVCFWSFSELLGCG